MDTELWIKMDGPYSKYSISNFGRVMRNSTGYICRGSSIAGYVRYAIVTPRGCVKVMAHRLVAKYFLDNYSDDKIVHHKNHIRNDNKSTNLEICTLKQNTAYAEEAGRIYRGSKSRGIIQYDMDMNEVGRFARIADCGFHRSNIISSCKGRIKSAYGFIWRYDDDAMSGENWIYIQFNNCNVGVSDLGRVRLPSGKITYGTAADSGYMRVCIGGRSVVVHKLVMSAFRGGSALQVNHIDHNKANNSLSNLEYVTARANVTHSYLNPQRSVTKKCRAVRRISRDGTSVDYKSIQIASDVNKISKGNIHMACAGRRRTAGGFVWAFL
jgi:hypothetical protein